MFQVTQNIVDDVCLFYARQDSIKSKYQQQLSGLVAGAPTQAEDQVASEQDDIDGRVARSSTVDTEERLALEEMMMAELAQVQLKSVPQKVAKEETISSKSKKIPSADIKNEHGIPSGKFGWCIVCRN